MHDICQLSFNCKFLSKFLSKELTNRRNATFLASDFRDIQRWFNPEHGNVCLLVILKKVASLLAISTTRCSSLSLNDWVKRSVNSRACSSIVSENDEK